MAKSLAVKYRPTSFSEVTEQGSVRAILQNQLDTGEIKNAYIFVGSAGCGKTTCARIFANEINKGKGRPVEMDAASNNSVDDVREITKMAQTKSLDSDYKVFILDEVHMFSAGAWAAMLKLIEEPPARSIFIMCTTDYWKIPKTILSRSQRFTFNRISTQGIINRLSDILAMEEVEQQPDSLAAIEYIARLSEGGMRDALTTLDKCLAYSPELTMQNVISALGGSSFDELFDLTESVLYKEHDKVIEIIEKVYSRGEDMKQFVKAYLDFCMDIYKFLLTDELTYTKFPETKEMRDKITALASDYNDISEQMNIIIQEIIRLDSNIKWSQSPKNIIEVALITM